MIYKTLENILIQRVWMLSSFILLVYLIFLFSSTPGILRKKDFDGFGGFVSQ
jgi:hypothetical protein